MMIWRSEQAVSKRASSEQCLVSIVAIVTVLLVCCAQVTANRFDQVMTNPQMVFKRSQQQRMPVSQPTHYSHGHLRQQPAFLPLVNYAYFTAEEPGQPSDQYEYNFWMRKLPNMK